MKCVKHKIQEYPKDLVKWVVGIALNAMNANPDVTEVYTACRFAIAIVTDPSRFSMSDHVTLGFNSYEGDEPSCAGYAGRECKIRITIRSTGVRIYWEHHLFDTFLEPSCHEFDRGSWGCPSCGNSRLSFEDCRDNHLYCCKTLSEAVAVIRGKRLAWIMRQLSKAVACNSVQRLSACIKRGRSESE